jgi:polyhydroxybutyrate depolymerase
MWRMRRHDQFQRQGWWYFAFAVLACAALLAGCVAATPARSSTAQRTPHAPITATAVSGGAAGLVNRPVPSTGCAQASPVAPGSSGDLSVAVAPATNEGATTRSYRVHVPVGYTSDQPTPLLLVFHGFGGTGAGMESLSGFSSLADQQRFLAVYPRGLPFGSGGAAFWASLGPSDFGVDDALFTSVLLDALQRQFCVDPQRIYATGFSNGGAMAGFLACELTGRIAAFAPVSGNFYAIGGGCHPVRPAPILDFHGTADPILPYDGIPASENPAWPLPPIVSWLAAWAGRDGCAVGPTVILREASVFGEQWTSCQGAASVVHYRIEGGGHAWPPVIGGQSAASVIWRFFQAHSLPAS